MDKATITEVISYLKESYISSGISVEAIALFGSALTDRMTPDSDLDLIVISTHFRNLDLFERAKLAL
ncbi:MAG: nucleotidyltransferase domain-containing protein, partial [Bacteroidales bacterium]|nr:nucleotidyltransferase domain-containing protein [Bacteroidales bacterium]